MIINHESLGANTVPDHCDLHLSTSRGSNIWCSGRAKQWKSEARPGPYPRQAYQEIWHHSKWLPDDWSVDGGEKTPQNWTTVEVRGVPVLRLCYIGTDRYPSYLHAHKQIMSWSRLWSLYTTNQAGENVHRGIFYNWYTTGNDHVPGELVDWKT